MKYHISIFFLFSYISIYSQSNNKLWQKLYDVKNKSFTIINHAEQTHPYKDSLIDEVNLEPIVYNNNIYCWIAGTGRLYKLEGSPLNRKFNFRRIDSTINIGNNYDAFLFEYKRELYSLGGYGFWRRNGQLKVFDTISSEWQIIPLNKEIPVSHSNTSQPSWYDPIKGKLFLIGYSTINEAEGLKSAFNDLMELDLKTKKWRKVGALSNEFAELLEGNLQHSINKFPISIASLPWGILVRAGSDNIFLLDIYNNEIKELDDNKKFSIALSVERHNSHFYVDSMYYAFDQLNEKIDSLHLTLKDFKSTGIKIYDSANNALTNYAIGSFSMAIFALFFIIIRKKRKNKISPEKINSEIPVSEQVNFNNDFIQLEHSEINILELLLLKSKQDQYTTIDDLNKVLGLAKKNINIQKKQRSDLIISLNRKLSFLTRQKQDIILKKRNPVDKRCFDYFIDPRSLEAAMKIFNSLSNAKNN